MGILARMDQEKYQSSVDFSPVSDFWYQPTGYALPSNSGVIVTPETAMRVTTVFACVKILSETIAQLPVHLYRRLDDDAKEKARDIPLYSILRHRPNQWQGSYTWRETLQGHAALRGNAYAIIQPGRRGAVDSLVPVRPDAVRVEQLDTLRLRYWIRQKDGTEKAFTQDEVFRVPGLSDDGITGLSPIGIAREAIGLAVATEAYGARFFKNDARPGGLLSTDQKIGADKRKEIRSAWQEAQAGENQHKVGVLDMGLAWTSIGMTSEDAQFLETRKFQREEIAALFRVPPHMAGDLSRSTNNNIEHQSIEFVVHTILPWVKRWEEAISRDLIPEEDQEEYFAEFDLRGLLRGDSATRATYYSTLFNIGALSQNDIRRLENENPVEGGNRYFVPLNMTPSDRVDEVIDAQTEPSPTPAPPASPADRERAEDPGVTFDAQAFMVLVEDVAERVAGAEIRELEKRAEKAAEDRPRFNAWVAEFYEGHAAYVQKAVRPLAAAWAMIHDTEARTEDVVARLVGSGRDLVLDAADVPILVASWRAVRAGELGTIILEALHEQD